MMLRPSSINQISFDNRLIGYIRSLSGLLALFPFQEASGTIAKVYSNVTPVPSNGAYSNQVLLAQSATPVLGRAIFGNASGARVALYSANLAAAFTYTEASLFLFAKVQNASVWTNGIDVALCQLRSDGANFVNFAKAAANNRFQYSINMGGINKTTFITFSSTDFFMPCITWSKTNDRIRRYMNGALQGAPITGIGTFASPLASNNTVALAADLAAVPRFLGYECYLGVFNRELTATEVLQIARLGGVA